MSQPRILMPSGRGFTRKAFQCALYEAQDVLCEAADVDLVCPRPRPGFQVRQHWQRRLMYRDITKKLVFANPGLEPVKITRDYDLLVVVCQNYWDLLYVNALDGWKDRCRTSVCWLDEVWVRALPQYKYWLHALNQFDHVFVGYAGTAGPLSTILGRPCHWLGAGVDAMRFAPQPQPPRRVIDVYSVGRGWNGVHNALTREAAAGRMFYLHDTLDAAATETLDHRRHREMYANVAKRSRFFMVAPGKVDQTDEIGEQIEIGYRYYEGSAAGAVMIGQAPDCDSFRERFDWPDAVIEVRPDGSDVVEILSDLEAHPDRLERISRRNSAEALLRHDWVHRWMQVFDVAGISRSSGMIAREDRLKQLAHRAGDPRASQVPAARAQPACF